MLTSLACLFLVGILFSQILERLRLPGLLGMILTGILLGPYGLNWYSDSLMGIAAELRQLALVLILLRAGLALDLNDLKRVGPAGGSALLCTSRSGNSCLCCIGAEAFGIIRSGKRGHGRGDRSGFPGGHRTADVEADGGKTRN